MWTNLVPYLEALHNYYFNFVALLKKDDRKEMCLSMKKPAPTTKMFWQKSFDRKLKIIAIS